MAKKTTKLGKEALLIAKQKLQIERLRKRPISGSVQLASIQQQQSRRRQRFVDIMGSRAEQLEIQAVSFDEVPMLHDMERQRSRKTTVSNRFLNDTEKGVTDSFPD